MSGISGYSRFSPSPEKETSKIEHQKTKYSKIEHSSRSSKYDPYALNLGDNRFEKREQGISRPSSSSQKLDRKSVRSKDLEEESTYLSRHDRQTLSKVKHNDSSLMLSVKEKDAAAALRMIRETPGAKENDEILNTFFKKSTEREPGAWDAKYMLFKELRNEFQSELFFRILLKEAPDIVKAKMIWDKWKKSPQYSPNETPIQTAFLYQAAKHSPKEGFQILSDFIQKANTQYATPIDIDHYNACLYLVKNATKTENQLTDDSTIKALQAIFYHLVNLKTANYKTFSIYMELSRINGNFLEVQDAYELAQQNLAELGKKIDINIHQNYIDCLVDQGTPEKLQEAYEIINKVIIPNWPHQSLEIRNEELDLHRCSYGCGYLWLRKRVENGKTPESFAVICGQGARDPGKYLAFTSYLTNKMSNDPIFQNWNWRVEEHNPGRIIFTKNTSSSSQMPKEAQASAPPPEEKKRERNLHDLFAAVARKQK